MSPDVHKVSVWEVSYFWNCLVKAVGGLNYISSPAAATMLRAWPPHAIPLFSMLSCSPWAVPVAFQSEGNKKLKHSGLLERAWGQLMANSWCSRVDATLASGQGPGSVQMRMTTSVAGPSVAEKGHPQIRCSDQVLLSLVKCLGLGHCSSWTTSGCCSYLRAVPPVRRLSAPHRPQSC